MTDRTTRLRAHPTATPAERILLHVVENSDGCWIWQCHISNSGYGRITLGGKSLYSHRVSYEAFVGLIPSGKEIDHLCRNRACCNPAHLEPVTSQVNVRRGHSPGAIALRRSECDRGHSFADHGVIRAGRRVCRICRIAYKRVYNSMTYAERMERKRAGLLIVDLDAYWDSASIMDR